MVIVSIAHRYLGQDNLQKYTTRSPFEFFSRLLVFIWIRKYTLWLRYWIMARCSLTLTVFIIFSILIWSTCACGARGTDTLKTGETLDYSSFLVSANGKFTLGFHVSDHNNSKYSRYMNFRQKNTWLITYNEDLFLLITNHSVYAYMQEFFFVFFSIVFSFFGHLYGRL